MNDATGWFVSLNYGPGLIYPNNINCQWRIDAQPGQIIQVDFTTFNTERGYDIAWLFDGNSILSPAIVGLMDNRNSAPPTGIYTSVSGGSMYIQFTSDASTGAAGFNGTYSNVLPSAVTGACNTLSRPALLTSYSGVINSLYYPNPYPLMCECQWLITSQEANGYVQLDFTVFLTQANSDWVVIYDGNSQSGAMIARLSGQYTPAPTGFLSTQQFMFVRFVSDEQIIMQGFRAVYTSIAA